jgi:F-type H+-transporting ATPase subunit delta
LDEQSIARRYAKAIFELAVESNAIDAVAADLSLICEIFECTPELADRLTSPLLDRSQKLALTEKLLDAARLNETVANALRLLAERHRLDLFSDIVESFSRLVDVHEGRVHGKVVSALPLEAQDIAAIADRLSRSLKRTIVMDATVDPDLLGGLFVEIDGKTIDGSVRGQLSALSRRLRAG